MVVDNGLMRSDLVVEAFGSSAVEEEVVVQEGSRHGWTLGLSGVGVNRKLHGSGIVSERDTGVLLMVLHAQPRGGNSIPVACFGRRSFRCGHRIWARWLCV